MMTEFRKTEAEMIMMTSEGEARQ
jgi:chromosome segregation ATPase